MSKRGRPPLASVPKSDGPEKRAKAGVGGPGGKSDVKPEAGKRGAPDSRGVAGAGDGKKAGKRGEEGEEGEETGENSVKLFELPQIMPPPPCLFLQAIVPPSESGSLYVFEGWSLNQLDGLGSDFDHISRVVADLEPLLSAELEKMEQIESEAGGLPVPCIIEGSAGGSGPLASGYEEEAAGNAASGEHANKQSVPAPSHSRVTAPAEDSFVEGEEGEEYEEEDEEDYSAASTTSGPKKAQTKTSFWGWMDQYFVPFNRQHLDLLKETKIAGDRSFVIPRLGPHFTEKWAAEDGKAPPKPSDKPRVGDMTARLLAALVCTDDPALKKPKRRPDAEALKKSRAEEIASGRSAMFNKELAAQVDERLRAVLAMPQLAPLSHAHLPPLDGREDDEICETIRSLQSQLKQQIKQNNALKAELRPVVEKRMELQAKEEEAKQEWNVALAKYEALMQNKKKK